MNSFSIGVHNHLLRRSYHLTCRIRPRGVSAVYGERPRVVSTGYGKRKSRISRSELDSSSPQPQPPPALPESSQSGFSYSPPPPICRKPLNDPEKYPRGHWLEWARPLFSVALQNRNFEELADARLGNEYNAGQMFQMVSCAANCVRFSATDRPRMSQIALLPSLYSRSVKLQFLVALSRFSVISAISVSETWCCRVFDAVFVFQLAFEDHYMRIKTSRSSNIDSPSDVQSNQLDEEEMNLYLEAAGGKNKKGRIFGLGSEAKNVDSSAYSYGSYPPSINTMLQPDIENVVTELRQENHNLKQQNEIILTMLEALEQKLSGAVDNSNLKAHNADDNPP